MAAEEGPPRCPRRASAHFGFKWPVERPEVPPRPTRKREARANPSTPENNPRSSKLHNHSLKSISRPSHFRNRSHSLRKEISGIKVEAQSWREQLGIRDKEIEVLNERLRDTGRRYEESIVDMRRNREEKQELEDIVGRLGRVLDGRN
jgi:hypothetical protein